MTSRPLDNYLVTAEHGLSRYQPRMRLRLERHSICAAQRNHSEACTRPLGRVHLVPTRSCMGEQL